MKRDPFPQTQLSVQRSRGTGRQSLPAEDRRRSTARLGKDRHKMAVLVGVSGGGLKPSPVVPLRNVSLTQRWWPRMCTRLAMMLVGRPSAFQGNVTGRWDEVCQLSLSDTLTALDQSSDASIVAAAGTHRITGCAKSRPGAAISHMQKQPSARLHKPKPCRVRCF
ncbi:hypothetical protein BT67DRAFT_190267 [Trichocladium antarcticum]|uniref:Uncharacterized protein n=1 Tax=Trichocladium antarcticum TaxID=1450529 RepID=A0AAN6ZGA3_9PEZI|nr:hypothetical protein BT67DRAFT_190267 [Trichocladium antarcticum]